MKNIDKIISTLWIIWTAWFWTTTYVLNKAIDDINESAKQIILPNSNIPLRVNNIIIEIKDKASHYSNKI